MPAFQIMKLKNAGKTNLHGSHRLTALARYRCCNIILLTMRTLCCALLVWFTGLAQLAGQSNSVAPFHDLPVLTNVSQLSALSPPEAIRGYPIRLAGTVTFLDTNRSLIVLQDETGAIAINLPLIDPALQLGQVVCIESSEALPYFTVFPDYPFRPSGWDIRHSFEAPENWGDYHLTRMRGFLHPTTSGEYTFWIASDNSSELWLSSDADPGKIKKIASIGPGSWVDSHDWSALPSQRSEGLWLKAGEVYYIEALQEQLTLNDNLAVAWKGPRSELSVIDGAYLSPWVDPDAQGRGKDTNGILREYWTNYTLGNVFQLTGPRQFQSQATVKQARISVLGTNNWPDPLQIHLDQALDDDDNYRWVECEGAVTFVATNGDSATFELTERTSRRQVRVAHWKGSTTPPENSWIQVRGVCEGRRESSGWVPDLIWAPSESNVSVLGAQPTNSDFMSSVSRESPTRVVPSLGGYFITHGVVTFNDRVFDQDCLFIQDVNGGVFILQDSRKWGQQLQVGQFVEIGGELVPGPYGPSLRPIQATAFGGRPMPDPAVFPVSQMAAGTGGLWTEFEGVARSVDTNGVLSVVGQGGPVAVWLGQTPADALPCYVDATIRLRGVLSLRAQVSPLLLVPSREFVEIEESAPHHPFALQSRSIADLSPADGERPGAHRVKVAGVVTYTNEGFFYLQDTTGGLRVEARDKTLVPLGDCLEALGFPASIGSVPVLTEAVLRPTGTNCILQPRSLDVSEPDISKRAGSLVRLKVNLLNQQNLQARQVLEVQQGHRVFEALLPRGAGILPTLSPGSLLALTGICEVQLADSPGADDGPAETPRIASLRILLRTASDIVLLKGPPWWTWRGVAVLIGALLAVLMAALLGIHLLRRRLARQEAARLEFSRKILESQEGERRRIAVNLHDSLGQNLLVIMNQARRAMLPAANDSALRKQLDEISSVASQAIEEVRQITHDLRPYQLDRLGLNQALRALISRMAENSTTVFASHVDDIDGLFDKKSEIHIYRIIQEGINNVVKHSNATEATFVIKRDGDLVSISIRDNGRGFDMNSGISNDLLLLHTGLGLSGVSERASILGGKLTLESRPGQGTTLKFELAAKTHEIRHQTADY
jgi:signal transduction histidine kinase